MKVTAIITYYRNGEFVGDALASVMAQTRAADEILIVDDASPPEDALVQESLPPGVRLLTLPHNGGPGAARQVASEEARGDLLAYLDADDLWEPTKLARQLDFFTAQPEAVACHTGTMVFDRSGVTRSFLDKPKTQSACDSLSFPQIVPSSLMVRRAAVLAAGGWNGDRRVIEDWDFEIRLTRRAGPLWFIPEPLTRIRRWGHGNLSGQHRLNIQRLAATVYAHRREIDACQGRGAWRRLMGREIAAQGRIMGGAAGRLVVGAAAMLALGSPSLKRA